jgi:hypothetical protein
LSKLERMTWAGTRLQNLTREQSYDIVNPREHSQVLRRESHYCRYAARASSGLAVLDCPVMNASAVSAWDTSLPGLLTLRKDGLPECRAGGDHLYRLYRLCRNSGATVVQQW